MVSPLDYVGPALLVVLGLGALWWIGRGAVGFARSFRTELRRDPRDPKRTANEPGRATIKPNHKGRGTPAKARGSGASKTHQTAGPSSQQVTSSPRRDRIFLCYRRADSADVTGRIYDRLSSEFGRERILRDIDSIGLGDDFRERIDSMVDESGVFVAIIGPGWMGVSADPNERRIDEVNDFVRLEIASALERSKRVIPVLVRGATMPAEEALPPPIKKLTYKNGMSIRPDPDFDHDVRRLIDGIEAALRSQ